MTSWSVAVILKKSMVGGPEVNSELGGRGSGLKSEIGGQQRDIWNWGLEKKSYDGSSVPV